VHKDIAYTAIDRHACGFVPTGCIPQLTPHTSSSKQRTHHLRIKRRPHSSSEYSGMQCSLGQHWRASTLCLPASLVPHSASQGLQISVMLKQQTAYYVAVPPHSPWQRHIGRPLFSTPTTPHPNNPTTLGTKTAITCSP
jgi:hypothetical protein